MKRLLLSMAMAAFTTLGFAQGNVPKSATPIDPIDGVLDAFKSHAIVALGEGRHGNEQGHAFRLALIRDPRFAATVNDIVVEFGNSHYQALMDRFVRGEEVSDRELRQVWQNTTQFHTVWDRPIYEEFFRALRAVNASLPNNRKLRVLLGDPPVDFDKVKTLTDFSNRIREVGGRDAYPAALIQREVVEKKRRALLIYGDMHFLRKKVYFKFSDPDFDRQFNTPLDSIVDKLESSGTTTVFSIWTYTFGDPAALQPDIASWRTPSMFLLRDTNWGRTAFTSFYPSVAGAVGMRTADGQFKSEKAIVDPDRSPLMQEQFDAILYIGSPASLTISKLSPTQCADAEYFAMRSQRMDSMRPQPARGSSPSGPIMPSGAETLKRECDRAAGGGASSAP